MLPFKKNFLKNSQGHTLVEMLVVIAVIGSLAVFSYFAVGSIYKKARDVKRVSDLKSVAKTLDMYRIDQGVYPDDVNFGDVLQGPDGFVYYKKLPTSPVAQGNNFCDGADMNSYIYSVSEDKKDFSLIFCLESSMSDIKLSSGCNILGPNGFRGCRSEVTRH